MSRAKTPNFLPRWATDPDRKILGEMPQVGAPDVPFEVLLERERLSIELTEFICEAMESKGVTRARLAKRLGVPTSRLTAMMRDASGMTLDQVADVFAALGVSPRLTIH